MAPTDSSETRELMDQTSAGDPEAFERLFAHFRPYLRRVVGARLDFILENYDSVKHDLLGSLFSGSGLVWYGGVLGGAIAGWVKPKLRRRTA